MAQFDSFEPYYPHLAIQMQLAEAASQSWVAGNLVYIDTSGYLAECGTDPASIHGVAAESAKNGTQGQYKSSFFVITPGSVWVAKSNTTTAQTHVGGTYGVVLSSNIWYVDISETGNTRVNIIALDPRDAVATSGGRYILMFKSGNIQGHL